MKKLQAALASVLVVGATFITGLAGAATASDTATSSGNGMRVSPVRTDLTLSPGQSQNVTIYVQNVTSGTENLRVIVNDFISKDETGAPSLLLNGAANPTHGLKKYISVPATITVPANQQQAVTVTVTIPKDAAGGGYYGAVRFAPGSAGTNPNDNVSLSGSVGSLILVSVPGNITENLQIASFDVRHGANPSVLFTSGKNLTGTVRFRNNGNVQEEPFGKMLLKKGNTTLGTYEINASDPRGNVLPDSIRKFGVNLNHVGSFGKYTLQGNFGYGANGQLLSASTTFYVVPLLVIILVVILVLIVLFLVFGLPRVIKNYNRRILRRAGRR